jgi:hypothetical protein
MKARYATPLVFVVLGALLLPPQLSHVKLAGSRNDRRIRTFLKPGTPTSCRIITWMQEPLDARTRIIAKEEVVLRITTEGIGTPAYMGSDGLRFRLARSRIVSTSTCFRAGP